MVRLRDSRPFSLSSAPTVGNPCRPLQPESVSRPTWSLFLLSFSAQERPSEPNSSATSSVISYLSQSLAHDSVIHNSRPPPSSARSAHKGRENFESRRRAVYTQSC